MWLLEGNSSSSPLQVPYSEGSQFTRSIVGCGCSAAGLGMRIEREKMARGARCALACRYLECL